MFVSVSAKFRGHATLRDKNHDFVEEAAINNLDKLNMDLCLFSRTDAKISRV